ncbi:MAG: hypothetical protein LRY55_14975 [Leadbetterella sp.]|nr:hypothetical protein [Leadbetterella sp.]
MLNKRRFSWLPLGIAALALTGFVNECETKDTTTKDGTQHGTWDFPKSSLIPVSSASENLAVDVYLDATTSMQGFASVAPH